MKAKSVTFGELVFRNEKALGKFLAAVAEADTLPNYSGDIPSIQVRDIDEKEIEYRNLPAETRSRYSTWEAYARGEEKDILTLTFDESARLQAEHGYSFGRFREARVRELTSRNDRAALEAIVASYGARYHKSMPQDLQVEIDACLSGRGEQKAQVPS